MEIDETTKMDVVLLDKMSEKMAARYAEWGWEPNASLSIAGKWNRRINIASWKK